MGNNHIGRRGISGDIHRIKEGSAATATEIREFMQDMRGKNPNEVLGAVASSGLIQGIALSTVGFIALLAVCTVVPYAWGKMSGEETAKAPAAAAADEAPEQDDEAEDKTEETAEGAADAATGPATAESAAAAAEKLGITGQKDGTPDIDALLDQSPPID